MIGAVVFDVGERRADETQKYRTWANWLGVPRHVFEAVFGAVIARVRTTGRRSRSSNQFVSLEALAAGRFTAHVVFGGWPMRAACRGVLAPASAGSWPLPTRRRRRGAYEVRVVRCSTAPTGLQTTQASDLSKPRVRRHLIRHLAMEQRSGKSCGA